MAVKKIITLVSAILLLLAALLITFSLLGSHKPAVQLVLVSNAPSVRVKVLNNSGVAKNFFYYIEIKTNTVWQAAALQPKWANYANFVDKHSRLNIDLSPAPTNAIPWRCCVGYGDATPSLYDRIFERMPPAVRGFLLRHYHRGMNRTYLEIGPQDIGQKD